MISYAQNAEDVILARALAGTSRGFYIDVGAASPTEATVTRHFYEAGWHGINIEPVPQWAAQLRSVRRRDLNLEVAAGAEEGELTFYRVADDPSLSTLSEEVAHRYQAKEMRVDAVTVPITTLDRVLEEASPERIDFLKIDVEGAEAEVLGGIDLRRWRPRVIVVEATEPYSFVPTHDRFEHLLTGAGYLYASTDGINRYYVPEEESALVPLLVPANALDDFVPMREQLLIEEIGRLRNFVRQLQRGGASAGQTEKAGKADEPLPPLFPAAASSAPARVAVLATPQSGSERLTALLADLLGVDDAIADHPADVVWEALPARGVVRLTWPRTEHLRRLLARHGFSAVTIARHPLDVLVSICRLVQVDRGTLNWLGGDLGSEDPLVDRDPTSAEFLEWALGARAERLLSISAEWWSDLATARIRYEELDRLEAAASGKGESRAPVNGGDLEELPGGWRAYLTAEVAGALLARHGAVAGVLGYPAASLDGLPDAATARRNWEALCAGS